MIWENHFAKGTQLTRVPVSELTVENGLKETRLFALKRKTEESRLVAIVSLQIKSLLDFLNLKTTMNPDQVIDTAEIIVSTYDDFSFTAIMDCFQKIKTNQEPFKNNFYERLDGRKLLSFFDIYRDYQLDFLQRKHEDKKVTSDFSLKGIKNKQFAEQLSLLKRKLIVKNNSSEPKTEASPINEMIQEWLKEYDELKLKGKLPKKIVSAQEYLRFKQSQLKSNKSFKVTDSVVQKWANEFWELRDKDKLHENINTYTEYFEYRIQLQTKG